jgi:hypothetical protein
MHHVYKFIYKRVRLCAPIFTVFPLNHRSADPVTIAGVAGVLPARMSLHFDSSNGERGLCLRHRR